MEEILAFDQQATLALNGSESLFWDNLMTTVTSTWSWTALILMLFYVIFKNNAPKQSLYIILCIALMIFVTDRICSGYVKPTIARWRPTQDPTIMYLVDTVNGYRGGRFGFFSGHASNTFCVATMLALLFRDWRMSIALFFWCTTTTFTRLYLGVHYLGDVTVGAIVGIIMGTLFYFIYAFIRQRTSKVNSTISEQYTSSGYLRYDINNFLLLIVANYIVLIIIATTKGI